ncbi:MAG: hypothetical protein KME04_04865 [Pleurocapsa minor GSE-CHR-MK-17-07R]|nr:hypothetical protein [Pleurocapsa minor GSE-CHR-MK 17-07R]
MQRLIGNQAVSRLLQPARPTQVKGKNPHLRVQRTLIDGKHQEGQLDALQTGKMDNTTSTHLYVALIDYAKLMQQNTNSATGQDNQAKGESFYADVDHHLSEIARTSISFLNHDKHKKLDTGWLRTLIAQDIPETRAAARWVQNNFSAHLHSTYLNALKTANDTRKTQLMDYVENQSAISWAQMSDAQKQLLEDNRDRDAERVGTIRKTAQAMMAKDARPREVLAYMSAEAVRFVQDVVRQYVEVTGLKQSDLAVVSTGSFGSGEMFPYSDVDVQIMTGTSGKGALGVEQMNLILHNVRMRVRIANMQESNGKWKNTMGWDVDQLVQDAFDPEAAVAMDPNKGLAQSSLLYATNRSGENLAKTLKGHYTNQGKEAAKAKMEIDLYAAVRQGDWWLKDPAKLDDGREPFEFKEKFMRLPKIFLNVLAMYYGLTADNSWARVDELIKTKKFSPDHGARFKEYIDIVSAVRLKYQFFYQQEGLDTVSPTAGRMHANRDLYPKGYYTLTNEDRASLKTAQQIQKDTLVEAVLKLRQIMYA